MKDVTGRYMLVNRRFEQIFHLSAASIFGKTDYDIFEKEQADAFRAMDDRVIAANDVQTEEETATQDDGTHAYLSVKAPLRNDSGRPYAVFGISTDITERKNAERTLRAQLERLDLLDRITRATGEHQDLNSIFHVVLHSLEEQLPVDFACACLHEEAERRLTVVAIGPDSRTLDPLPALDAHSTIDIDRNGLQRCVRGELLCESDVGMSSSPLAAIFRQARLRSMVVAPLTVESRVFGVLLVARRVAASFTSSQCEFLRQLSQHIALAAHQAQLYADLQAAYEDLRQSQQTILQQERLRALGQMASGIAHDINNALSPATLYVESLIEREKGLSEEGRNSLTVIQRAIDDAARTVARMREFYREREKRPHALVDVNSAIGQVMDLTRARWSDMPQERGKVIQVLTDLAPSTPFVLGSENEIRDALTNLVLNAVDAMPEGGTLTLVSRGASDNVVLEVRDTGVGMDENTRNRCMEPFFSTKGERGTGLGLAMVYGMVQRHDARIEIESEPGVGTTVRLIFSLPPPKDSVTEPTTVRGRGVSPLHVLLVDDDPLVLKTLRDIVELDGHFVTTANGGQAGIDTFTAARGRPESFDVVITDLGMPHIDGRAVARSIKTVSPSTPVMLLTGWGQRMLDDRELPEHVDRVLSKPPTLAQLRSALLEAAGRSSAS